ncbi:MAG: VCBS repeat-containing protein, partial [Anaerolineales bacterium]
MNNRRTLRLGPTLLLALLGMLVLWSSPAYAETPTFGEPRLVGPASGWTRGVAVGDVDGDGDLDLVVGNSNQQNFIYLNDGSGGFDWPGS